MKSFVDLDSVTFVCPCGASATGEGKIITEFIKCHKQHTNGELDEFITDDGMRIFSSDTPRQTTRKL
jgi:hypothetical protein